MTPPTSHSRRRVGLYVRVSTTRQAEADLSVPDQIRAAETWCAARAATIEATFIEAGASGLDEDRPEFQRMLAAATAPARPFDLILVHSLSRFSRDTLHAELAIRRLRKAGVEVASVTQEIGGDGTGEVVRKILSVFDEYSSRENAKHTRRAMVENARQGFWNGSVTPFGYRTQEAGRKGARTKKVLVLHEQEASVVRRIFATYAGESGAQRGVKAIAEMLNAEGGMFRGKRFAISNVHRIMTSETYAGTHWFNRIEARTGRERPQSEWVAVPVPAIVSREAFDAVQTLLASRSPKVTPPRVVNSPVLLTGLAVCASCGAGMTTRTGKSGRYRYYACAGRAQKGATVCRGCAVPMATLDGMIVEALTEDVFRPARLQVLLEGHIARKAAAVRDVDGQLSRLRGQLTEAEGKLRRLLDAIETGAFDLDDPLMRERLAALKAERARLRERISATEAAQRTPAAALTPEKLDRIGAALRNAIHNAPPDLLRDYLRLFVGRVVVSREQITVSGPIGALAQATEASPEQPSAEVLTFVRKWRPVRDSNPCCQRERLVS